MTPTPPKAAPAFVRVYLPHAVRGLRPGWHGLVLWRLTPRTAFLIHNPSGTRLQLPRGDVRETRFLTRRAWDGIARNLERRNRMQESTAIRDAIRDRRLP